MSREKHIETETVEDVNPILKDPYAIEEFDDLDGGERYIQGLISRGELEQPKLKRGIGNLAIKIYHSAKSRGGHREIY